MRRSLLAVAVSATLLAPPGAAAQEDEIQFPPVGDGRWEGLVNFSGYVSSDSVSDDGSFATSITDVIGDTVISFDLTVDGAGNVTQGAMKVDLTWFVETVGAAAPHFDPYRVVHDQHQTGTLDITGNAARLVASGTLTHTTNTMADGNTVEEVSGTEQEAVQWVFRAVEASCVRMTFELVEATGLSLMATALVPRDTVGDGSEIYNRLVNQTLAWPASVEDPEAVKKALAEVTMIANELTNLREYPQATHPQELVDAWRALEAELASLDECQSDLAGFVPQSERSWLIDVLQVALNKALDNEDTYDAQELIDLWDAGVTERALDGALVIRFLDAFNAKLNEAIANNDTQTITDILAFASAYGWPNLYSKAKAAL